MTKADPPQLLTPLSLSKFDTEHLYASKRSPKCGCFILLYWDKGFGFGQVFVCVDVHMWVCGWCGNGVGNGIAVGACAPSWVSRMGSK